LQTFKLLFGGLVYSYILYGVMRRTKEQIRTDKRPKTVADYIKTNKFLSNPIHHKNNYWSWAAYDSWAARGQAGCYCGICLNGHYNGTLKNRRAKTKRGGKPDRWPVDVSRNACYECVREIEKQLGVEFKRQ
jgi:hypothetical protein